MIIFSILVSANLGAAANSADLISWCENCLILDVVWLRILFSQPGFLRLPSSILGFRLFVLTGINSEGFF